MFLHPIGWAGWGLWQVVCLGPGKCSVLHHYGRVAVFVLDQVGLWILDQQYFLKQPYIMFMSFVMLTRLRCESKQAWNMSLACVHSWSCDIIHSDHCQEFEGWLEGDRLVLRCIGMYKIISNIGRVLTDFLVVSSVYLHSDYSFYTLMPSVFLVLFHVSSVFLSADSTTGIPQNRCNLDIFLTLLFCIPHNIKDTFTFQKNMFSHHQIPVIIIKYWLFIKFYQSYPKNIILKAMGNMTK